jgi:hypothetical protein
MGASPVIDVTDLVVTLAALFGAIAGVGVRAGAGCRLSAD